MWFFGRNKLNRPVSSLFNDRVSKRVFVGLSGGVDSATSACLLKEQGYDVTGVFIKVWQPDWIECNWKEDRLDAMKVCAHLGIPFLTLDLEKEYKKEVIDYMVNEYSLGRTPNPDVMCNKHIKFGAFYKWAMDKGADYVATGHYAQILPNKNGDLRLIAGQDPNKDQTYFLWNIKTSQLPKVLFPIGHLLKPEVRKLAEKYALPNFNKKDSQGLCFIGKVDIKKFLSHYIKSKNGDVLNISGEVIGQHNGALFFTIGERHGFTITKKSPNDLPMYVVSKDINKNTITVDTISDIDKVSNVIELKNIRLNSCNWIGADPKVDDEILVRIRYRQELQKAKITEIGEEFACVELKKPQTSITKGQSLVAYNDEGVCLGGGIII
jgi:tRNA-specific 2-thiouridylase